MELYTDTSNVGYGAYWAGKWFSESWPHTQQHFPIAWKELYAILVACTTWDNACQRKRILFHCDNAAVVSIWQRGSCRCRDLMAPLFFIAATGNYHVSSIAYIPGVQNSIADHLSRLSLQAFRCIAPAAEHRPTPCSADSSLTAQLHHFQLLNIAPSTRCTYQAGINHLQQFSTAYQLSPLPSPPHSPLLLHTPLQLCAALHHQTLPECPSPLSHR